MSYELITVAEARLYPGLSAIASSDDGIIEALIDSATYEFERFWRSAGVQRTFTEDYTWHDISGWSANKNVIWLRNRPIVSVTSITDPDGNTIASDEYWIDKRAGALRTTGQWAIPQDANGFATYWTIVYVAGHWASTAAVPPNIKDACKMQVAFGYKNPDPDIVEKQVGDLRIVRRGARQTELRTSALSPNVEARISYLRRHVV